MVPATPRFTVYHKTPATFPGKRERRSRGRADPGSAAGSGQGGGARRAQRQEVFSPSQSVGWTGSPCASLLTTGGHSVDMDHCRGVYVGGVEPATLASGQQGIAYVRDLQKHKPGGKETEDLVLKVIIVYFLYFEYVFDNISFKNSTPFSSKLNLIKKAVTLVVH